MPSDRERSDSDGAGSALVRAREWFVLDGDRGIVAGTVVVAVLVAITAISFSGFAPLSNVQPLYYVFSALIGGNVTLVTVVVSINQLLLSRELNRPHELRSQIDGVIDYRRDVEEASGRVPPVEPSGFLRLLIEATRQEAQRLGGLARTELEAEAVVEEIDDTVETVTNHADEVDEILLATDASTVNVLSSTLSTNYARQIHDLHRVATREDLPEDVDDSIDGLVDHLQDVDVARQYFKTIYLQEELASLSRVQFYVGLPAILIVAGALLLLTASPGASITQTALHVAVPLVVTTGLVPLCVLFPYILRVAIVTERTAATMPFSTPGTKG